MSTVTQTIRLRSAQEFGKKVPPEPLGEVLQRISVLARRSVMVAVRGSSILKGSPPCWLAAVCDMRLVDLRGQRETLLSFESPRLGEAAPELYEHNGQRPSAPDPQDTALDLLADVLADLAQGNPDSSRFDPPLLHDLTRLRGVVESSFQVIEVLARRYPTDAAACLNQAVLETVERFRIRTPPAQYARVAGTLDMLRVSTRSFAIRLIDGQELPGVLLSGDLAEIASMLGKPLLVVGRVYYRPSGRALRIDAEQVSPATADDLRLWSSLPAPRGQALTTSELRKPQGPRSGVAAIIGRWPGDENDEEIETCLKRIS